MTQYLVTGAAGFMGSHLIRKLKEKAGTVHALVRPQEELWRINDILQSIALHEVDLTDHRTISELIATLKPEVIYHCASYGGMPFELQTEKVYEVNFTSSMNLFNECKKQGFKAFIATGSSSEYGRKEQPLHEDMLLEPVSDYAVAKAAATQFFVKEALFNKLPVYVVRPFSVYGDAELSTRLIPTILKGAIHQTPVMLSHPHYVRDYIYISDMIDALIAVEEALPQNRFVFNAGTGTQSTIQDVVNTVGMITGYPLEIVWGTQRPREWEPKTWMAAIKETSSALNWKPKHTLRQGLEKSLIWFKKFYNHANIQKGAHESDSAHTTTTTT